MKRKWRFENFTIDEGEAIKAHLEKMARKGWRLKAASNSIWEYEKIPPRQLAVAVTYFKDASGFDPQPGPEQQDYHSYFEAAGWQFAAQLDQMQVFYSENLEATPPETDEAEKLENIHGAMKRGFLPANTVLMAVALFLIFTYIPEMKQTPGAFFSDVLKVGACACWLLLVVWQACTLGGYLRWYRASKKQVALGGACLGRNSRLRRWAGRLVVLALVGFLAMAFAYSQPMIRLVCLVILAGTAAVMFSVPLFRGLARRLRLSRGWARFLAVGLAVVLYYAIAVGGAVYVVFRVDIPDRIEEPALKLDSLTGGELMEEGCRVEASPLLRLEKSFQAVGWEDDSVNTLRYELLSGGVGPVMELVREEYLQIHTHWWEDPQQQSWQPVDPAPWLAEEAWQLEENGRPLPEYLIFWEEDILWLEADFEPDPAQAEAMAMGALSK